MRLVNLLVLSLIVLIQYPLWWGKGGWLRVWHLETEHHALEQVTHEMQLRNAALEADVQDLKSGVDAVEERARKELGMMRPGERIIQILPPKPVP